MKVSRFGQKFRDEVKDRGKRMLRSMLSTVAITAYEARERITYQGREAADGSADTDTAEHYGVIGVLSRPPKGRGRAIVAHIGGEAEHPVVIATTDDETRTAIISAVGLDWDEIIVHSSSRILKVTKDDVLIGRVGGDFGKVAMADHTHALPALIGQATYASEDDPTARTGRPDSVSEDTKVT
jgi:hypothetical protein